MATERAFAGEGRLTTGQRLGGKSVLGPIGMAFAAVVAIAVYYAPDPARPLAWLPIAAGAALPIWLGHRAGLWRALFEVLRGEPARGWRIDVDELGVRHVDLDGSHPHAFDWFEIERYDVVELGLVLWLRLPKGGANAVILPRTFFPAGDWEPLVALVREKLPGSARAHDEAKRAAAAARGPRAYRALALWIVLVGALVAVWAFFVRE